jgi:hypothetical protein
MFTSTIIRTARPLMMAAALAAAGLAGSAFVAESPAFARGGGGGNGGGGGGGGGGDNGAGGGGGEGSDGIYAVLLADRERADALTHVPPPNTRPRVPPRQPPTVNVPRQRIMYTETTYCGGGSIRIVYDVNGDPMRYLCVRGR